MTMVSEGVLSELADRVVVSPGYGRFVHRPPAVVTAETEVVRAGDALGLLETSAGDEPVAAPTDAFVLAYLVRDGERVRPGSALVHLRAL